MGSYQDELLRQQKAQEFAAKFEARMNRYTKAQLEAGNSNAGMQDSPNKVMARNSRVFAGRTKAEEKMAKLKEQGAIKQQKLGGQDFMVGPRSAFAPFNRQDGDNLGGMRLGNNYDAPETTHGKRGIADNKKTRKQLKYINDLRTSRGQSPIGLDQLAQEGQKAAAYKTMLEGKGQQGNIDPNVAMRITGYDDNGRPLIQQVNPVTGEDIGQTLQNNPDFNTRYNQTDANAASIEQQLAAADKAKKDTLAYTFDGSGADGAIGNAVNNVAVGLSVGAQVGSKIAESTKTLKNIGIDSIYGGASEQDKKIFDVMEAKKQEAIGLSKILSGMSPDSPAYAATKARLDEINTPTDAERELINRSTSKETITKKAAIAKENKLRSEAGYARDSLTEQQYKQLGYDKVLPYRDNIRAVKTAADYKAALDNGTLDANTNTYNASAKPYKQTTFNAYEALRAKKSLDQYIDPALSSFNERAKSLVDSSKYNSDMQSFNSNVAKSNYLGAVGDVLKPNTLFRIMAESAGEMALLGKGGAGGFFTMADNKVGEAEAQFKKATGRNMTEEEKAKTMALSIAGTAIAKGGIESIFGSVNFGKLGGKAFNSLYSKLPNNTKDVIGKYASKYGMNTKQATEEVVNATKYAQANNLIKTPKGAYSTKVGNTKLSTPKSTSQVKATGDIAPGESVATKLGNVNKPKPADIKATADKNINNTIDKRIVEAATKDDRTKLRKALDLSWKATKGTGKGLLRGAKATATTKAVTAIVGEAASEGGEFITDSYAATGGSSKTKININQLKGNMLLGGVLGGVMHGAHAPAQAYKQAKITKKTDEAKQSVKDYIKYSKTDSPDYNPLKAAELLTSDNMHHQFIAAANGDTQKGMTDWQQAASLAKQNINTSMAQRMLQLSDEGVDTDTIMKVHDEFQKSIAKINTYENALIAPEVAKVKENISTKNLDTGTVDQLADVVAVYGANYFTDQELQRTMDNPAVNDSQKAMLRAAMEFNGARASFAAENQNDPVKLYRTGEGDVAVTPDGRPTVGGALDNFKRTGDLSIFNNEIAQLRRGENNDTEIRMWTKAKDMAVLSGAYIDSRTQQQSQQATNNTDTATDGTKAPDVPSKNIANKQMRTAMQTHKVGKMPGKQHESIVTRKQGNKQKFFLNSDAEAQAKLYENKKWKNNPELKDVEFGSFKEYVDYTAREVAAMNAEGASGKSLQQIQDNNANRTKTILSSMNLNTGSSSSSSDAIAKAVTKKASYKHIPASDNQAGNFVVDTNASSAAKVRNLEKDKAKFNNPNAPINKLIAFGLPGSSTDKHAAANSSMLEENNFSPSDIVGISINGISRKTGKPTEVQQAFDANTRRTMKALRKAIDAKATIVADNAQDRARPYNQKTEGAIAGILQQYGYHEIDNSGVWVHGDNVKSKAESTDQTVTAREQAVSAMNKVKDAIKNLKVKRKKSTISNRETRGLTASPTPNTTYKAKDIKLPDTPELSTKTVNAVRYGYLNEILSRMAKMKSTPRELKRIIKSLESNPDISLFSQAISLAGIGSINTTTKTISRINKERIELVRQVRGLKLDVKNAPDKVVKLIKTIKKQQYAVAYTNDTISKIYQEALNYQAEVSAAEGSKQAYNALLANTVDVTNTSEVSPLPANTDGATKTIAKLLKPAKKLLKQKSNVASSIIGSEANLPSKWKNPDQRAALIARMSMNPHQVALMDVLMKDYDNFAKNYVATSGSANKTNYKFLSNYLQDMSMLLANKNDHTTPENVMFAGQLAFREYVLRNAQSLTMPTERDAKAFFGRSNEDSIDGVALDLIQNAGLPINIVAPSIGQAMLKSLNVVFDSSTDEAFQKNMESALGMHVLAAMQEAGELEFNEVSNRDIGRYHIAGELANKHATNNHVTFVKLHHAIEKRNGKDTVVQGEYATNNAKLFQQFKSALDLFDMEKSRNHSFKPIKEHSKYVEGSVMHVDAKHRQVQESLQSVKFVANDIAFDTATKLGIDAMMDLQGYNNDVESLHVTDRPGAIGKNRHIENEVREAFAFLDEELRDKPKDGEDVGKLNLRKGFYLHTKIISSTRIQEVSNSIKIQGSSLHRQMYGAEAWDTDVHMNDVQVMQAVSEILEEQIGMTLDEAMENSEIQDITDIYDKSEYSAKDKAKLVEFAKDNENFASIQALHIVSNYRKALKNRRKKFRVFMPHETDGVSNGVISAKMQLPPGNPESEAYVDFMARGGVFVNNEYTTVGDFLNTLDSKGNKHVDNYMNIIRVTAEFIDEGKRATEDTGGQGIERRGKEPAVASKAQWDAIDAILPPILDSEGNVTREARKVGKLPLMTTIYGAGKDVIFKAQFSDLLSSLYADMASDTPKFLNALDTLFPNGHSFRGKSLARRKETKFTDAEVAALEAALEATYGNALAKAIDEVLHDFLEGRNVMNAAGALVNAVFVVQFEEAYKSKASELGKLNLTRDDVNNLLKEFRDANRLPSYLLSLSDSEISGAMIGDSQNVPIDRNQGGIVQAKFGKPMPKTVVSVNSDGITKAPGRATKSLSGTLTKRTFGYEVGVKPFQVLNISVDSAVNTLTAIGEEVANVHDATLQSVQDTAALGGKSNLAYLKVHSDWSMVESMDRAIQRAYSILTTLSEEQQAAVENVLADARQNKFTGEQMPVIEYSMYEGVTPSEILNVWEMFADTKKAARAEFLNRITGVGQFDTRYGTLRNFEGEPEVPKEVKTYTEDLKENLEEVVNGNKELPKYKIRLGLVPTMTVEQSATVLAHNLVDAENGSEDSKPTPTVMDIAPIPENFKDSPYKAVTGDVLSAPQDHAVVITTNGNVSSSGKLTMGKGLAKQAKQRFPGIEDKLGELVKNEGNIPHMVKVDEKIDTVIDLGSGANSQRNVISLPTKPSKFVFDGSNAMDVYADSMKVGNSYVGWKAKSSLNSLEVNLRHLVKLADKKGLTKISLTLPGYGEGGLKLKDIKPLLDKILDDRFTLHLLPYAVDEEVSSTSLDSPIDPVTTDHNATYDYQHTPENERYLVVNNQFEANPDQKKLIDKVTEFMMTEGTTKFILQGRGGTGKTSSLSRGLLNYASEHEGRPPRNLVYLSTISHQAKNVLADASEELSNGSGLSPDLSVLASLFGMQSTSNGRKKPSLKHSELRAQARKSIVVVDEVSMVDDALLKLIDSYIGLGGKVIFMGDYHQIMPVKGSGISSIFREFNDVQAVGGRDGDRYSYELRQIMRQKEGSGILDIANHFADVIDVKLNKVTEANATTFQQAMDKIKDSNDTSVVDSNTSIRKYLKLLKEGDNDVLYTTYKNKDVHAINTKIREGLYGNDGIEYHKGERLIAYGNQNEAWTDSQGVTRITNSSRYTVKNVEYTTVETGSEDSTLGLSSVTGKNFTLQPKWKPGTRLATLTLKGEGVTPDNSLTVPVGLLSSTLNVFKNASGDSTIAKKYRDTAIRDYITMYALDKNGDNESLWNGSGVFNPNVKMTDGVYTNTLVGQMFPSLDATLMYGYASTVHKAQGSGFKTSFTTLEPVRATASSNRTPPANNAHINYTAVTRAKNSLYIVSDNAVVLSKYGQPDKELLGSNSEDFDINELKEIADVEITPATISETFENLTTLGGKKDSTAHEQRLRELLNSVVSPFLNTYSMVQKIKQVKKNMATGASEVGISRATIYAKVSTTSKPGLTSDMSNVEVYTHELMHPIIRKGFGNNPDLRIEAQYMLDTLRRRYDKNKLIDMLMPESYTGTEAEERANIEARYNYLFNNDRSGLEEFVVHGLTNEALIKALGKEKFQSKIDKAPVGFWEKLADIFSKLISRLAGHKTIPNITTTMDKALLEIAYASVVSQQSAIAGIKTNKSNFLNRYNNMAIKGFRDWVSRPMQKELKKRLDNVPANASHRFLPKTRKAIPLAILAQRDTTYWNNEVVSKGLSAMVDNIGISREFFGRQIIAEITGMDNIAKEWRGMLRRFKHSLDSAAMDVATGYASDMKKSFSKNTTDAEWASLTHMMRTDPNALLNARMRRSTMEKMYSSDSAARQYEIGKIINKLKKSDPNGHQYLVTQAKSLGNFLATGDYLYHWGMPNAKAIATYHALDSADQAKVTKDQKGSEKNRIKLVDALATLVAIDTMPPSHRSAIHRVMKRENARKTGNGISALLDAQQLFIKESKDKLFTGRDIRGNSSADLLMTKGYIKEKYSENKAIKVGSLDKKTRKAMAEEGFFPVLNSQGEPTPLDAAGHNLVDSYIYATRINGMSRYLSGAMSTVNEVSKGTSLEDRYIETDGNDVETMMNNRNAANITERSYLSKLVDGTAELKSDQKYVVPILREKHQIGKFTPAYQYRFMMNHKSREQLLLDDNLAYDVIGGMFGSIVTKQAARKNNESAIHQLYKDFGDQYIGNEKAFAEIHINSDNPRYKEYWKMLPDSTKQLARQYWGRDVIYIHKSLIPLVMGYRKKEFTEWLDSGLKSMSNNVITLSGIKMGGNDKNMKQLMKHSGILWDGVVKRFKSNVVVKMPSTFGANYLSNIVVSWMNGMSLPYTISKQAEGLKNLIQYQEDKAKMQRLERYLARQPNHPNKAKIKRDIAKYDNALKTNAFHVLIEEGMVSTIVDDVDTKDNPLLKSIKVVAPGIHKAVIEDGSKQLPKAVRDAYNIAIMNDGTKVADLAYKATQYSDAVARYAEYYYFREEDGQSHAEAINNIAEDFITYDDNTNPLLQWTNDIGLFMFTKFFLRSQRVIWKQLKNKPVNVLAYKMLDSMVGIPDIFDSNMLGYDITNRFNGPSDILDDAFSLNMLKYLDVIIPD